MSKMTCPLLATFVVGTVSWRLLAAVLTPDVGFVLPAPKVAHLTCGQCASTLEATFRRLGVETKRVAHDDHTDIHYSCPRWRVAVVDSHEQVDDWKRWLHQHGFATNH